MLHIPVCYHGEDFRLEKFKEGDWVDLRAAETVTMEFGEYHLISLGVSMKLPEYYEAHIVPRSSTYKTWGIIQANSLGVIDNSYSGDEDIWRFPAICLREETKICKGDRICQFRIMRKQPEIIFVETDSTGSNSRGGFGTTGTNDYMKEGVIV